jgi:hypothetical protein
VNPHIRAHICAAERYCEANREWQRRDATLQRRTTRRDAQVHLGSVSTPVRLILRAWSDERIRWEN